MWGKEIRTNSFFLIYQAVFFSWENYDDFLEYFTLFKQDQNILEDEKYLSLLQIYFDKKDLFETNLKEKIDWDKTFDLIKAVLITFLIEKEECSLEELQTQLVSKYLRLTQEFADNHSVSLVHAVISKLLPTSIE